MYEKIAREILSYFPSEFYAIKNLDKHLLEGAQEIRLRIGQQTNIKFNNYDTFLGDEISKEMLVRILENFCSNSIYAMQNEINQGYITVKGGHRIGIAGTCVFEESNIKNIKDISSVNIRLAREVKGIGEKLLGKIVKNRKFNNTIILSPPGCGKTTIIRDTIRILSDGNDMIEGKNIGLIDERSEIAAIYKGIPQNDVRKKNRYYE